MDEMESLQDGTATTRCEHFNLQMQGSVFETPPPTRITSNDSYSIWGNNNSPGWDGGLQLENTQPLFADRWGPLSPSSDCFSLPSCASCGEDTAASHFCTDCKDLLCALCVQAHLRVRVTRDHQLIALHGNETEQASASLDGLANTVPSLCPYHEGQLAALCEWCHFQPLCSSCFPLHRGHKITPLGDVKGALAVIVADSREEKKKCDEVEEEIGRMVERVDSNAQAVACELTAVINLHVSALEERQTELLALVETTRGTTVQALNCQTEVVQLRKSRHLQMTQMLDGVREEQDMGRLAVVFDELVQMHSMPRVFCRAVESDSIKFISPYPGLLPALRGLGCVESGACAATSHILGVGFGRSVVHRLTTVTIQMRDACSQVCSSIGQQVGGSVIAPDGTPLDVTLSECDNGLVVLSYLPVYEGTHALCVTVRGMPISGCPVQVEVRGGRNYDDIATHGQLFAFGGTGTDDGQLCRPWGICCDLLGRIIVADRSNNRVQIFDKDGKFLAKFGSMGTRDGQFDRPAGITTNTLNQIIVADKDNHRIQIFDQEGGFIRKFGERGRLVGMFCYPWGVAANSHNHIAVADTRNNRVQLFTGMGQYMHKCDFGFGNGRFNNRTLSPRGLCFLPDGGLLLTDFNNHRVAVLLAPSHSLLEYYGGEGATEGEFSRPQGVAMTPDGHIVVCDTKNNRVQIFAGEDMQYVASFGGSANGFQMPRELPTPLMVGGGVTNTSIPPPPLPYAQRSHNNNYRRPHQNLLDSPTDVCVSPEGRIYVVDFGNNCIRVF